MPEAETTSAPPRPVAAASRQGFPLLRAWSRVWRYAAAGAAGAVAWTATAAEQVAGGLTEAQEDAVGAILVVDFLVGMAALGLLPLRRRRPPVAACLTAALCAVSVTGIGPAAVAIVSMATWRRRAWTVAAGVVFVAARAVCEGRYQSLLPPLEQGPSRAVVGALLDAGFFAAAVLTGHHVATRRELIASLHDRARTADREQALAARVARDAERNRIARDMHDVMAHRLSLVALHAGALAHRGDLDRERAASTARTIQTNAQLALTELRQVLGLLRADHDGPQPTLAELPALLADAREAGATVRLDTSGVRDEDLRALPETLSCTALRIVQEALTNARKHAPAEPVTVRLAGRRGTRLELEVRNRIGVAPGTAPPSAGLGLTGLAERVRLAGGELEYGERSDGSFAVLARLPWPA
ncbi:sensor histidine kinase [Planomonospora venezuelensis]|uniref:histidine kinase n=1 Tax=Planomonospora venezuelensis TaxID=1999 RepID=A0A841D842_PLAVE|nr:histidine kinase [Planomonospora venezuelensis]MBB5964654.1 signal transduction histidine kinase [Planomonospora venezuelensis]